jgi:hypothetical protein
MKTKLHYPPSCLDAAYERYAIDQGLNYNPVFPENKEYMKTYNTPESLKKLAEYNKPRDLPTWEHVILDMKERNKMGELKYGVMLRPSTPENMLQHAYEEALDLAVYLKTEILKQHG